MSSVGENNENANANKLQDNLRNIRRTLDWLQRAQRIEKRHELCTQLYDALAVMFIADNVERFEPRKFLRRVQRNVVLPSVEFDDLMVDEYCGAMRGLDYCYINDLTLSELDEVASELKAHGESLYAALFHYCELRAGMTALEVMLLVKAKKLQQQADANADDEIDEYDKNYSFGLLLNMPDGFKEHFIQRVKRGSISALPADNTNKALAEMSLPEHPEEAVYALCFQHMICLLEQVDLKRLKDITEF